MTNRNSGTASATNGTLGPLQSLQPYLVYLYKGVRDSGKAKGDLWSFLARLSGKAIWKRSHIGPTLGKGWPGSRTDFLFLEPSL